MKKAATVRSMQEKEVLNPTEVAGLLGLSEITIYRLVRKGELPGRKVGRHWRFRKDLLMDWLGNWENRFDRLMERSREWAMSKGVTMKDIQDAIEVTRAKIYEKSGR